MPEHDISHPGIPGLLPRGVADYPWHLYDPPELQTTSLYDLHKERLGIIAIHNAQRNLAMGTPAAFRRMIGKPEERTESSLDWSQYVALRSGAANILNDPEAAAALSFTDHIHDMFKNPANLEVLGLPEDYNHDQALRLLFDGDHQRELDLLLPLYTSGAFSPITKTYIRESLRLPVNWPGLMQSQSSGRELEGFIDTTHPTVIELSFWHSALDIAGALGYRNPTAALALNRNTANTILDAAHAFLSPVEDRAMIIYAGSVGMYRTEHYLSLRGKRYGVNDLLQMRVDALDIKHMEDLMRRMPEISTEELGRSQERRTEMVKLLREYSAPTVKYLDTKMKIILANMARAGSPEQYNRATAPFDALPTYLRMTLCEIVTGSSFDLDYGPNLYQRVLTADEKKGDKPQAVKLLLRAIMAAVEATTFTEVTRSGASITVAMRELAELALDPGFDPKRIERIKGYLAEGNSVKLQFDFLT